MSATAKQRTSETMVLERVGNDLKDHVVTLLHDGGPNRRHFRCQKPGTWNMGFDVVTWPGYLCYTGDMGEYLFCRTEDMIAFMRGSCMSYSYAAEKCVASREGCEEFSEGAFNKALDYRLEEGETFTVYLGGGKTEERSVSEAVEELRKYSCESEYDAIRAMYDSGLWDGSDLPSCKDWTFRFLWCLHALKWLIAKLDAGTFESRASA